MSSTLVLTALAMGLLGGPHCIAMCGAACAGFTKPRTAQPLAPWLFLAGRLTGYATLGLVAGQGMEGFAALAGHASVLRPLVLVMHLGILAWGLTLLAFARQPAWVEGAGRRVWGKVRPAVATGRGVFVAGVLWALMPCGLLYSALVVAALTGSATGGATAMLVFAAGTGIWLLAAPRIFGTMRALANRLRDELGTRLSGLLLVLAAAFALWVDVGQRIEQWCSIAPH